MPALSPAAPAFQPRTTGAPTAPHIRQAYLFGQEKRSYGRPYLPRTSFGSSSAFRGNRGRRSQISGPTLASSSSSSRTSYSSTEDSSVLKGGEILAHPDVDNQQAALELRQLLEGRTTEDQAEPASTPLPQAEIGSLTINVPNPSTQAPAQEDDNNDPVHDIKPEHNLLSYAFEQQYSSDWRQRDISRIHHSTNEENWKNQNNHLLLGQPTNDPTRSRLTTPAMVKEEFPLNTRAERESSIFQNHSQPSSEYLRLQGLGEGSSRNEYGRNLSGGQELGQGVIGNTSSYQNGDTTVVVSEAGCDIPMIREPWFTQPQLPRAESEDSKTTNIGPHTVSLNPDLPPLAVEHPARVWNSMIHSLNTNLQPVIKWDYEKIHAQEEGQDTLWLAQLTLVLPPTHPIIAEHPLYRALPKNRWKKEYVSAVEALGGIKRWVGEPKRLKADAQNTTLVKCISEDALAWVLAPNGIRAVPESDDEDEEDSHQPQANDKRLHAVALDDQLQHLHPDLQPLRSGRPSYTSQPVEDSNEIKIDEEDLSVHINIDQQDIGATASSATNEVAIQSQMMGVLTDQKQDHPGRTPFQRFMDALHRTLGPGGINISSPATFASNWEPFTNKFGYTLTVGTPGNCKLYQEPCNHTYPEEAQNAVCQKAIDLNVIDFMEWVKESLTPSTWDPTILNTPSQHQKIVVRPPYTGNQGKILPISPLKKINWQGRLSGYCSRTGNQPPSFHEQLLVHEGTPALVSGVTIGGQTFAVPNNDRTTEEVREYIARRVLVDYFGQKAENEEPLMVSGNIMRAA